MLLPSVKAYMCNIEALESQKGLFLLQAIEILVEEVATAEFSAKEIVEQGLDARSKQPSLSEAPSAAPLAPDPHSSAKHDEVSLEPVDKEVDTTEHSTAPASLKQKAPAKRRACPCGSGKRYKNCCQAADTAAARRAKSAADSADAHETDLIVPLPNLYI